LRNDDIEVSTVALNFKCSDYIFDAMDPKTYDELAAIAARCADTKWANSLLHECIRSERDGQILVRAALGSDDKRLKEELLEFKKRNRKIVALLNRRLENPSVCDELNRSILVRQELERILEREKYRDAGNYVRYHIDDFLVEDLLRALSEVCDFGNESGGSYSGYVYFIKCAATALKEKTGGGAGFLAEPLAYSMREKLLDAVLALVQAGADVASIDGANFFDDPKKHKGCSFLHAVAAIFHGRRKICEAIIKAGHPIDVTNDAGVPVIDYFPAAARAEWADEYFAKLTEKQIKKAAPRAKSNLKKRSTTKSI